MPAVLPIPQHIKSPYCVIPPQALTVGTVEPIYSPGVLVGEVQRGAIGERAGLQRGDLLTRVGPLTVPSSESSLSEVVDLIRCSEGGGVTLALLGKGWEGDSMLAAAHAGRCMSREGRGVDEECTCVF